MVRPSGLLHRVGIIGAGQLGRMMILAGKPRGFSIGVLAGASEDPAASLADHLVRGGLRDREAILELARWADVTTFEIEHIDTDALVEAVSSGAVIRPDPGALRLINDKLLQKQTLERAGVPVPAILAGTPESYPVVQKLRHGGYDGRGVAVLRSVASRRLSGHSYYEELVDIEKELAVIVARNPSGEQAVYPPAEMSFDAAANICSRVSMPARVGAAVAREAVRVAVATVEALDLVGVVAVELFLARDGRVLVNEVAPRPHNSGHLTIEACATSQFEQHLRAVCDLPLGATTLRSAAVMVNLLGSPDLGRPDGGAGMQPYWPAQRELLARPSVAIHWYGKREVRPYRKMGHLTITASTIDEALAEADRIGDLTWIGGMHG